MDAALKTEKSSAGVCRLCLKKITEMDNELNKVKTDMLTLLTIDLVSICIFVL